MVAGRVHIWVHSVAACVGGVEHVVAGEQHLIGELVPFCTIAKGSDL